MSQTKKNHAATASGLPLRQAYVSMLTNGDAYAPGVEALGRSLQKSGTTRPMVLAVTSTYDGGDQGFLNLFFKDWYAMPVAHRLPIGYNMHHFIYEFLRSHDSLRDLYTKRVKIVHYTLQKPWMRKLMLSGGAQLW